MSGVENLSRSAPEDLIERCVVPEAEEDERERLDFDRALRGRDLVSPERLERIFGGRELPAEFGDVDGDSVFPKEPPCEPLEKRSSLGPENLSDQIDSFEFDRDTSFSLCPPVCSP